MTSASAYLSGIARVFERIEVTGSCDCDGLQRSKRCLAGRSSSLGTANLTNNEACQQGDRAGNATTREPAAGAAGMKPGQDQIALPLDWPQSEGDARFIVSDEFESQFAQQGRIGDVEGAAEVVRDAALGERGCFPIKPPAETSRARRPC